MAVLVASTWLAGPAIAAAARSAPKSLTDRGRLALVHSGYRAITLTCAKHRCRWSATRHKARCSGLLVPSSGRAGVRIVRGWCIAPHSRVDPVRPPTEASPQSPASAAPASAPVVHSQPAAPSPSAHPVQFGFNTYITPQTIALEQQLGASVTRMIVPWSTVQAAPGQWNWQQSDQEYSELVSAGLRPEIVAFAAPCWARPSMACDDSEYTGPPDVAYDAAWSEFVSRLTARYPLAIGIEIWNEPNLNMFFWPRPDPARFTHLLTQAYHAVKAVNATMPVISGGIAGSPATGVVPLGEGDRPFLAAMYAAGAAGSMDAIAAHPYPIALRPDGSQAWDPAAMEQSLNRLRAARDAAGDHSTPIWITEVGESTSTQDGFPPAVSPAQQALDLMSMIASVRADPDVQVMIIQSLQDQSAGTADSFNGINAGFGMFSSSGTGKPAGCALSVLLHGSLSC